jgi:hypothetical protein
MRRYVLPLLLIFLAGCSTALSENELNAYFDRQKGSWLPQKQIEGYSIVEVRENLVEFIPQKIPKSGWAVVWMVDTSLQSKVSAHSTERLAGKIVSWRIIGDRSKVRIPISYSAG